MYIINIEYIVFISKLFQHHWKVCDIGVWGSEDPCPGAERPRGPAPQEVLPHLGASWQTSVPGNLRVLKNCPWTVISIRLYRVGTPFEHGEIS